MPIPRAVIIIPTVNEAAAIGGLLDRLFTAILPSLPQWDCWVLVVDGASEDGTADIVRAKQDHYPQLALLPEDRREGIGAAYCKGFTYAMATMQADILIEFDGDGQHPPATIPLLLAQIQAGADYVLGSRLIPGGSFPAAGSWGRLLLTRVGGLVIRLLLFFPSRAFVQITDPTTGLRATRVAGFADRLDYAAIPARGFAYKMIFLHEIVRLGARVAEIPLNFRPRTAGASKLTRAFIAEFLRTLLILKCPRPTQAPR